VGRTFLEKARQVFLKISNDSIPEVLRSPAGWPLVLKILLEQWVPHGDVISPYIFTVAAEILLIQITYTRNLIGITFGCVEGRSETFANDTTIYIERTP
jgi:hypothetical protein